MPEPDFLSEFGFVPVHSFLVPLDTWDFHLSESQFSQSDRDNRSVNHRIVERI